jgi:hypothetical protein
MTRATHEATIRRIRLAGDRDPVGPVIELRPMSLKRQIWTWTGVLSQGILF